MSRTKSIPTTEELSSQIKEQLESSGDDIDPIPITSQSHALQEMDAILQKIDTKKDWDVQIDGMNHAMKLINGGLFSYEVCMKELPKLGVVLVDDARNLRSALVKASTLLIAQIAKVLREKFDLIGEVIQPLSCQTNHGTQIIADSCKYTIIVIASNVGTKKVMRSVFDLATSKAGVNRQIAAECIGIAVQNWKQSLIENNGREFASTIVRLMSDAQSDTRQLARGAAALFISKFPKFRSNIVDNVDERSRNMLCSGETPAVPESGKKKKSRSLLPTTQRIVPSSSEKRRVSEIPRPRLSRNPSPAPRPVTTHKTVVFQRRSKSPMPNRPRPVLSEISIQLVEGKSAEFLDQIEEYVNTNRQFMLSSTMASIASGLVQCITKPETRTRAELFIESLIDEYASHFEPFLTILFNTLFEENNKVIASILANYNPNSVITIAIEKEVSTALISLLASLCSNPEIELSEDLSSKLLKITENNQSANAQKIILAVHKHNPDLVLLDCIQPEHNIPPFNPQHVTGWCKTMKLYVEDLPDDDWPLQRNEILTEIANAVAQTNHKNTLFTLATELLQIKGCDFFAPLLPPIFANWQVKTAYNSRNLWNHICDNAPKSDVFDESLKLISEYPQFIIDAITQTVTRSQDVDGIAPSLSNLLSILTTYVNSETVEIRKSCVFCFVSLSKLFKKEVADAVQQLKRAQQKLIAFYCQQELV